MRIKLAIGVFISLACLYFVFRGISVSQLVQALHEADLRWVAAALAIYMAGYLLRTLRWEILLRPVKQVSINRLFPLLIIGFFANNVLPFRMGELVRAHVTGQKLKISRTASLATIVLERLCDTISFLTTFLTVAFFFPFPSQVKKAAYGMGGACIVLIIALLLTLKYHTRAFALLHRTRLPGSWKAKLEEALTNFAHGISSLKEGWNVVWAMGLSLVIWTIEGLILYLIAHAFPIHISFPQSFFLLFFLGLSVTLPQAPGYVGTMELFGVTALSLLGIPREHSLPIILTIHGAQFSFIFILGFWSLWKEGLSLRNVWSE